MTDRYYPSAFPICDAEQNASTGETTTRQYIEPGMTLRDYFAAKALPLAWAAEQERPTGPYSERMEPTYAGAATRAYLMADAMLKARQS